MFTPAPAHGRRAHYLFAASLFGLLGFHVGVWAVQLRIVVEAEVTRWRDG